VTETRHRLRNQQQRRATSDGRMRMRMRMRAQSSRTVPVSLRPGRSLSIRTQDDRQPEQKAPSTPTTEQYLRTLSQSVDPPTLADLEKHRPPRLPALSSPTYNKLYNDTLEHLSKSFTKNQLIAFEQLLGRQELKSRKKKAILENVMAHGLHIHSPSAIERAHRERTEVHSESITLPPSALFFLLGKDGADLLQLSNEHNVHVSLAPEPLALSVSGLRASILAFCAAVKQRTEVIHAKRLPSSMFLKPPSLQLLRKVSRLSGAFLEPDGPNVRINATDERIAKQTEYLLVYLTNKEAQCRQSSTWILQSATSSSQTPPSLQSPQLALFPMYRKGTFGQRFENPTFFRLSQVAKWILATPPGPVSLLSAEVIDQNAMSLTLREALERVHRSNFGQGASHLTASFGHHMFDLSDNYLNSQKNGSNFESSDIFTFVEWLRKDSSHSQFAFRAPETLMTTAMEDVSTNRQLIYTASRDHTSRKTLTLDLPPPGQNSGCTSSLTASTEFCVNVLVPAKTYDLRLELRNEQSISSDSYPAELLEYNTIHDRDCSILPPVEVNFDGLAYYLTSFHEQQLSQVYTDDQMLHTIVGTKSDLLTGEKDPSCSISTPGWRDTAIWRTFLRKCEGFAASPSTV